MSAEPAAVPLVWMLIAPVVGLLAGFALMLSGARARRAEAALEQARRDQQAAADRAIRAEAQGESHRAQVAELREALRRSDERADLHQREQAERYDAQQQQLAAVQADRRALRTQLDAEREQSHEKLSLLIEAREQLSHQFKALASEILDEKSRKFTEQNQLNLGQLLNPLQERLKAFQTKVEEVYVNESKDRSALVEQVKNLTQLNNALSQDTQNLTQALKGDRKAQGNWGEIILDDVLEKAGLMRGQHYVKQGGVSNAEGQSTSIPDVVIRLPGERFLVVDSKLTLPDYRAFAAADEEGERSAALRRHLAAIRAHIKGLSEKKYQTLYDLKSLDFVVMFVPLEPAFTMAVTHDSELFQHAWEKNVLLVSPSTLLFVVRTVANLWRQEDLSRNAKDISAQGAKLYEKLVGFVADLDDVGKRIQQANESFGEARRKLRDGNGNLIGQAEKLRKLGIKPSKALPSSWVESAADGALDLAPPEGETPSQPK
ncbi:MAG: DNA recombination protein RmuC [Panacagrimonas sp.]